MSYYFRERETISKNENYVQSVLNKCNPCSPCVKTVLNKKKKTNLPELLHLKVLKVDPAQMIYTVRKKKKKFRILWLFVTEQ